jgi:glutathione S-transferase
MAAPVGPKKVHRYTVEFKIQAVRLSLHPEIQTQDVAHALDIHPFMLSKWKKDYREGKLKRQVKQLQTKVEARAQVRSLERQLAALEVEHDLLKKSIRFNIEPRRSLSMTITITAFERSPDGGKGLARDTRVRWALEEVGQPYQVRLVSFRAMKEPEHLALHPFGQIPTYEEGDLALFETGAIVFHIAGRHAGLLPDDANARARAITWMFAALNSVEPPILELANARLLEGDKPWSKQRMPLVEDRVRGRLNQLSVRLGDADWLDGAFSAGDLLMVSVLLRLKSSGILDEFPNLAAYLARGEARPAYKRAFDAQLAVNTGKN